MLKLFPYFVHDACQSTASCLHVQNVKEWFHPICHSTPNSIAKNYKMPRLSILNEIIFCCIFIFFLHGPFHSRTKLKLSKDHSIHGSKSNYLHGPFHSPINVQLYPHTIPFTDHSLHGEFTDRCHGPIIYRLNVTYRQPFTDHSIHGPFLSTTVTDLY